MSSTSPAASSTRSLLEDLRALGEGRAPASLHPAVMAELGSGALTPVLDRLGDGYTYGDLKLVRAALERA